MLAYRYAKEKKLPFKWKVKVLDIMGEKNYMLLRSAVKTNLFII